MGIPKEHRKNGKSKELKKNYNLHIAAIEVGKTENEYLWQKFTYI